HRNSDVESFMDAAEYLSNRGYYCIRMGHLIEKPLTRSSKRIIDYATNFRTDFGDIYLSAKCRFFIGDPTGIIFVPSMFNKPVISVNLIPFGGTVPFYSKDLYIPKKFWYRQEERYLTYTELLESRMLEWGQYEFNYRELGVDIINNTPEEILDVAREMDLRLSGKLMDTDEDIAIMERYNSLFVPEDTPYGAPSRIGLDFLNKNRHLFGF
ncbi:MAG TPA: TIGR04372 family glycosyltransferase, partial [Clostridia bacterium]